MSFTTGKLSSPTIVSSTMLLAVMFFVGGPAIFGVDIEAVTRSGVSIVLAKVDESTEELGLTIRGTAASLEDPVVNIKGLEQLPQLAELRLYHVPQIADYGFLKGLPGIRRLVISFAQFQDLSILRFMPNLVFALFEFCGDWSSIAGSDTATIDLTFNSNLEYLGVLIAQLTSVPELISVPESLKYLDLSYNPIQWSEKDIEILGGLSGLERIFVYPLDIKIAHLPNVVDSGSAELISRYLD